MRTVAWISPASSGTMAFPMTPPGWLTTLLLAVVIAFSASEARAQAFRPRNGKLTPVVAKAAPTAPVAAKTAAPAATPAPVPTGTAAKKPAPVAAKAGKAPGRRAGTAKKKRKGHADDDVEIKDDDDDDSDAKSSDE